MCASKVVVITGASAGVGRETVRVFARNGYDVALLARGLAGLEAAAREVEELGQRCLMIPTDVSDFNQVDHAATRTELELGPIDVWVNDAMTTVFSPLSDIKPEDFERAVHVTFLGQVWGTMAALQRMRPRDEGIVINVGSALAFVGIPLQSAYCASKFACRGFFEATRAELLHDRSNVRMAMVHLPAMNTPQFDWCQTTLGKHPQPVPPIYQPEIAANAIFETAIDAKRSRIVGSWNKMLVFMDSLFPGLGNHYASLGAWDSQLTKEPVKPNRPSNLHASADEDVDYGGHGIFDNRANGVKDPKFLVTLPKVALTYLRACDATVREGIAVRARARQHRGVSSRRSEGAGHERTGESSDSEGHGPVPPPPELTHRSFDESSAPDPQSHDAVPPPPSELTHRSFDESPAPDPQNRDGHVALAAIPERTSLDVLENEDKCLLQLIEGAESTRGPSVEERYEYGNLAKEILRHLAIRQSSLIDVGTALSAVSSLSSIASRMVTRATDERPALDHATKLARAVQPVALNAGQDFDGAFEPLLQQTRDDIEWDLGEAIPRIRQELSAEQAETMLRSAHYVRHHAPTYLSPKGPRWYERVPVVSRLLTYYEHLNDFPRAARDWRST